EQPRREDQHQPAADLTERAPAQGRPAGIEQYQYGGGGEQAGHGQGEQVDQAGYPTVLVTPREIASGRAAPGGVTPGGIGPRAVLPWLVAPGGVLPPGATWVLGPVLHPRRRPLDRKSTRLNS